MNLILAGYILFVIKGYYSNISGKLFCLKNNRKLLNLADRISAKLLSGDTGSDDLALESNAMVSLSLTSIKKSELDIDQEHEYSLVRVLHHIMRNPVGNVSVRELARMANMSPGVFCEKFRSKKKVKSFADLLFALWQISTVRAKFK